MPGGRFVLQGRIGAGGGAVVVRARDRHFSKDVAIKLLRSRDTDLQGRFTQESEVLREMDHPAIVRVLAHDRDGDDLYTALELLEGHDLGEQLLRGGPLPWRQVIEIGIQIASALEAVHRKGLVHRDVKPANIMLADGGEPMRVKLIDFGIVRVTENYRLGARAVQRRPTDVGKALLVFDAATTSDCPLTDNQCKARLYERRAAAAPTPAQRALYLHSAHRSYLFLFEKTGDVRDLCEARRTFDASLAVDGQPKEQRAKFEAERDELAAREHQQHARCRSVAKRRVPKPDPPLMARQSTSASPGPSGGSRGVERHQRDPTSAGRWPHARAAESGQVRMCYFMAKRTELRVEVSPRGAGTGNAQVSRAHAIVIGGRDTYGLSPVVGGPPVIGVLGTSCELALFIEDRVGQLRFRGWVAPDP